MLKLLGVIKLTGVSASKRGDSIFFLEELPLLSDKMKIQSEKFNVRSMLRYQ